MAGRWWTCEEVARLIDMAGKAPVERIAAALGRTPRSVESMARRLRQSGTPCRLRSYRPRVIPCPMCGGPMDAGRGACPSPNRRRHGHVQNGPNLREYRGVCLACWYGGLADECRARLLDALDAMPDGPRKTRLLEADGYAGKRAPRPRPEPADTPPWAGWADRKRAEERALIECEDAAAWAEWRRYRATQRRLNRVRSA